MSDNLNALGTLKFKDAIEVGNKAPSLKNDFLQHNEIVVTLDFKNSFLRELFVTKNLYQNLTYIEILNSQLQLFKLLQCERLEDRLRRICSSTAKSYSRCSGGKQKYELGSKVKKLAVFRQEVLDTVQLSDSLTKFRHENVELVEKSKNLLEELQKCLEEKENVNKQLIEAEKRLTENDNMLQKSQKKLETTTEELSHIKEVFRSVSSKEHASIYCRENYENKGRQLTEVSNSQRTRKLASLKQNVTNALWFAESYGLQPSSVMFQDDKGDAVRINLTENVNDLEKMKEVLYIMDRFKISDQAYHEIATISETLPKLHSIINIRDKLNDSLEIHRTPGNTPGAYVNLKTELTKILEKRTKIPDKINIKLSGDGTKVSRISNYVVISFSILDENMKLSSGDQPVLAIVKTTEKYDSLQNCLSPVFKEINDLHSAGEIEVNGKSVEVNLFFGGDMKFLQICLGLGASTGEYACPWCKVSKIERSDITKTWDFYHSDEMRRTIQEITSLAGQTKKQFGVKFKPLITIDPSRIIPDELHLLLRIFDVLLRNVIDDAKDKDLKAERDTGKRSKENIDGLVLKIRSCGVTFAIWESKSEDMDWTSLTGNDAKKVLRNLPDKLFFIIHNDTHEETVKLWKNFSSLYDFICSDLCETKDVDYIFNLCKQWVESFLALGSKRKGYLKKNVTPYIHCLLYHVPYFIENYGSLRQFSGQPTEKINDDIKSIHHRKTNRYDCALDALKVRKRIEISSNLCRERRHYVKKSDYWQDEIFLQRSQKKHVINKEMKDADESFVTEQRQGVDLDIGSMSVSEIKAALKDHGVATKIRKHEKLVELLKSVLSQKHS